MHVCRAAHDHSDVLTNVSTRECTLSMCVVCFGHLHSFVGILHVLLGLTFPGSLIPKDSTL